MFRPRILTRHPSHSPLRRANKAIELLPVRSVVRLGSTTEVTDSISNGGSRVEINTINAIKNSSSKLRMKRAFQDGEFNVKTADWFKLDRNAEGGLLVTEGKFGSENMYFNETPVGIRDIEWDADKPIVSKSIFGSRGRGNIKHDNLEALMTWLNSGNRDLSNYIFERFYNYAREYRLHVSLNGCFYTCRKMLKRDTPEENKWFRNDENCVWILPENELFDRPSNWDSIVEQSMAALNATGLDVGAIDLRIQSATNSEGEVREEPDFIIVEINSAPSFGEVTLTKYIEELPKLIMKKANI